MLNRLRLALPPLAITTILLACSSGSTLGGVSSSDDDGGSPTADASGNNNLDAGSDVQVQGPPIPATCATVTCSPNATCSQDGGAPTCTCKAGFAGDGGVCNDVDECANNPCQNGGTCANGSNAYTCTCPDGFTGPTCATNVDECSTNPCQNGGTCTDGNNAFTCACPDGFSGATCSTNDDECSGNPCQNGGTCTDGNNSFSCACATGFTGVTCMTNIDDCTGDPCQNGGTCNDGVDSYTCSCPTGFSGDNCEINVDDCPAVNPCQNGGACVDGVNSYSCSCALGYSGTTCETLTPTFLWVDASDASTITRDGANIVSEWRDKSGLGRHATIPINFSSTGPTWTAGVVNGLDALKFDGDQVRLGTAPVETVSEITVFAVFNMVTPTVWGTLINQAHDTYFSIRQAGGNGNLNFHIQNDNAGPYLPITKGSWKLVTNVRKGTVSTMYYDAASPVTRDADTLVGGVLNTDCKTAQGTCITLGNAIDGRVESMGGYLGEIRAFSSALSDSVRAGIEAELKAKWGIQ